MKFLIDMPLSPELAIWLAQQGHDAVHALDLGLARAADEVILERAQREQRVVVAADLDYPRLVALRRRVHTSLRHFARPARNDPEDGRNAGHHRQRGSCQSHCWLLSTPPRDGLMSIEGTPNVPVQRRAAQRTVRCNR